MFIAWKSLSLSRNSHHFIEPECALPFSQDPSSCPDLKSDESSLRPPILLTSILILSPYLQLGFPNYVLTSGLPQEKLLYIPPLSYSFYMPAYLALIELITQTMFDEHYESLSSSLWSFLHSPANSFLLEPNIFLGTLFAYTLTLFLSHDVQDSFHTHNKGTRRIIILEACAVR